jgi:hypothetical protein
MRRFGLAIFTLVLCLGAGACMSTTSPDGRSSKGEWMPDGTWCSGYVLPSGLCSEP